VFSWSRVKQANGAVDFDNAECQPAECQPAALPPSCIATLPAVHLVEATFPVPVD